MCRNVCSPRCGSVRAGMASQCKKNSGRSWKRRQRHPHRKAISNRSHCEQYERGGPPPGGGRKPMTTPVADRAILDTNVLLAATDEAREEHEGAFRILNVWPASGTVLYTSGQILREYLAVATRPVAHNGLGMARSDAVANVQAQI